jgi:hypothetical protein
MNMPRFTGEAALYKTNGHYRTGRQAINLSAEMIRTIHAAREEIEVGDCHPGTYKVELPDGTYECWSHADPWWGSEGGGGGSPGTPGEPGGVGEGPHSGGMSGGGRPRSRACTPDDLGGKDFWEADYRCHTSFPPIPGRGASYLWCKPQRDGTVVPYCCLRWKVGPKKGKTECKKLSSIPE